MNLVLKLEDAGWQSYFKQLRSALLASDTMLKKAMLIVWPKEAAHHFDREEGWDGPWAPWAESTRRQRMAHELATATAAGRARSAKAGIRQGGKLLQVSGKLRTQTVQNPLMEAVPGGLKVVSETPYGGFLDEGTSRMPARPFMWLGDDAQETLAKLFLGELGKRIGGTD